MFGNLIMEKEKKNRESEILFLLKLQSYVTAWQITFNPSAERWSMFYL